jgi:1-phosphatidylinositol-3-phosphate 5-kinase
MIGGKSGARFAKSSDERFVVKNVSKVELQMFLDFAPAYFEYMAKAYYHHLPTVLCKILGWCSFLA